MFVLFVLSAVLPCYLCQGPALYVEDALGHHSPVAGVHSPGPLGAHGHLSRDQTPPYKSPAYVGSFGGQQEAPHSAGHAPEHHGPPAAYHGSQQPQHVNGDTDEGEHGPEPAHDNREGYEPSSDDGKDEPARNSYSPSDGDGKDPYGGANEIGHDDYGYDGPHRSYGSSGEDNGGHPHHGAHPSDGGGSYHSSDDDGDHHYARSRRPHHASGFEEHSPRSRGRRRHRIRHSHHEPSEHHGHSDHHGTARVHGHDSPYHGSPIHGHHHHQPRHHHHAHSQGHSEVEGHGLHGGQAHGRLSPSLHRGLSYGQGHGNLIVGKPVKLTDDSMYGLTLSPIVLPQRPVLLADGLHHGYHPHVVDLTQAAPMAHYDLTPTMAGTWMAAASPFINTAHLKS